MAGPESEHIYGVQLRESADDGSDFSSADADYRIVFLGEDGFLHAKDSSGTVTDPYDVTGGANVGNLWSMGKTASQTLTNNTDTAITFDRSDIDGGGSVIDLANDRFVIPATGLYMVYAHWLWEGTVPSASIIKVRVGGSDAGHFVRQNATAVANGSMDAAVPLSLTSGDFVTLVILPGAVTGATARGNALVTLSSTFTLVRIT